MNSYKCILESEDLEKYFYDFSLNTDSFTMLSSKGIGGEMLASAALVTISAATISAVTKIIISLINKDKNVEITFKGNKTQFTAKGLSEEKVKRLIIELGKD